MNENDILQNILSFTRTEVLRKMVWNLDLMILIQRQLDEGKLPLMNSCLSASVKGNVIVCEDNVYFSASCMKPTKRTLHYLIRLKLPHRPLQYLINLTC